MIILGIDPGLEKMGYGVIESIHGRDRLIDYGMVWALKKDKETGKIKTLVERLQELEEGVNELIDTFHPDQVAIEELFFQNNVSTCIPVAQARGVILLTCAKKLGTEVYEYTPNQIKLGLCGNARADKGQMIRMVCMSLNLEYKINGMGKNAIKSKYDDSADALAAAIVHAHSSQAIGNFKIQ